MEHLPTELLDDVLSHLEVPDVCSLRLASPQLQRKSRPAFVAAFTTVNVDFSLANHLWLTNLATSDDIRLAVRHLRIGAWNWAKTNHGRPHGTAVTFGRGRRWWRLRSDTLNLTGAGVGSTVAVLHSFSNCTSVTVTAGGEWSPPDPPRTGFEGALSPTDALELVLHAYSLPGAPPLHRLRTAVSRKTPKKRPPRTPDGNVFGAGLEELTIELDREKKGRYRSRASDFVAAGSGLKALRLMHWNCAFHCQLAPGRAPGAAPPLESLTLGMMSVREADLLTLLSKLEGTLTSLSFYSVFLSTGTWPNVLEYLQATPFPALRRISMHRSASSHNNHSISWCPLWRARDELQDGCGGTFEFGRGRVSNWALSEHVIGVRFEAARGGAGAVKRALQAMMGYQHMHLLEPRETRGCESARSSEIKGVPLINASVKQAWYYERWTGIPVE